MSRPDHHVSMLELFEQASEAAELFSRLADFAGNICSHVGIEDVEIVLAATQERAKRAARGQLAKLIVDQMQPGVLQALFPEDEPPARKFRKPGETPSA